MGRRDSVSLVAPFLAALLVGSLVSSVVAAGGAASATGASRTQVAADQLGALQGPTVDVAFDGAVSPNYSPDTHLAVLRTGTGLEWYLVATNQTYRYVGSSIPTSAPSPASPVLAPSGSGFDRDYAGLSGVIQRPGGPPTSRIGFYHAEHHCPGQAGRTVNAVGIAFSSDSGVTWTGRTGLITSSVSSKPCDGFTGVGQPSVIVARGYVWVFFTDWTPTHANSIGVVRAPLSRAADPSAYRKYDGTAWTRALGGKGKPVIRRPTTADIFAASPSVSYNTALGRFVAVFETERGFFAATSTGLITWTSPALLLRFPQPKSAVGAGDVWQSYPTLLDAATPGGPNTGASNYLYFAEGVWPHPHTLVRRWISVGMPALPATVRLGQDGTFAPTSAQGPYAWACSGDVTAVIGGISHQLYDNDPSTGVLAVLRSGDETDEIQAPNHGATCDAAYPADVDRLIQRSVDGMLAGGCSGGCASVRVVEIDSLRGIVADYELP